MRFIKIESYIAKQALIAVCLNIAQLVNGYAVAWSAPMLPKLQNINETPLPYVLSESEVTWVATVMYFGIVGAFLAGFMANVIGRRSCLIISGMLKIISHGLLIAGSSLSVLCIGRFFEGVSMSFFTLTCNIYIGEIASPNIRGIIHTSMSLFQALGCLIAYSVGPFASYAEVGYVVMSINLAYVITSFFLPESPVYYVIKGNEEAAGDALRLLGRSKDIDRELKIMIQNAERKQTKTQWRELFCVRSNRRGLFVTLPLFAFQEASGIIAVIFFSTTIFKDAGSSVRPEIATILIGATLFVGTIFSPMVIEKYGRRILLMVSTGGCCVSMTILGTFFYLDKINHESVLSFRWLPLTVLVLALASYSVGLGVVPHTLSGELFAPKVRGLGSSLSLCAGWVSGFTFTTTFGYLVATLGSHVTFWLFAVINAIALMFVVVFVPETKGKSLTEIDAMMAK